MCLIESWILGKMCTHIKNSSGTFPFLIQANREWRREKENQGIGGEKERSLSLCLTLCVCVCRPGGEGQERGRRNRE